jgi:hypothetical protein
MGKKTRAEKVAAAQKLFGKKKTRKGTRQLRAVFSTLQASS